MIAATNAHFSTRPLRFDCSIAGVCVALLLVAGLITVPTTCECGADVSHGHSLFEMPGHHHEPERVNRDEDYNRQEIAHDYNIETPAQNASRLTQGVDRAIVVFVSPLTLSDSWHLFSYPDTVNDLGDGHIDTPEAPPPR